MPCLKIFTNLPQSKIPANLLEKIAPILSRTVGKPENRFISAISGGCSLSFHGDTKSPCAVATLESIGHIDAVRNKVVIKEISEFLEKEIGIKPERFFLTFYDVKNFNVGISNTTLDALER